MKVGECISPTFCVSMGELIRAAFEFSYPVLANAGRVEN